MSEFTTHLGHWKNKPMLFVSAKIPRIGKNKAFGIEQKDAWRFSEEHNNEFVPYMLSVTNRVCMLLGFEPNTQRMADLAHQIQSRIDDLVKAPPKVLGPVEDVPTMAKGRLEDKKRGQRIDFEVKEDGRYVR